MVRILAPIRSALLVLIGGDDSSPPVLPATLPEKAVPVVNEGVRVLTEYQDAEYARLYVDRAGRFAGRRGVDDGLLCEIARLLVMRMSYEDPIRIAQLKLAAAALPGGDAVVLPDDVRTYRLDDLARMLPDLLADPLVGLLEWRKSVNVRVRLRFSTASWLGARKLKLWQSIKRGRPESVRYPKEQASVERWLHMIDRGLTKKPEAVPEIVRSAAILDVHGDSYRQALRNWHFLVDNLIKPGLEGPLRIDDLAGAIRQARAAAERDLEGQELAKVIAGIKAGAAADATALHA